MALGALGKESLLPSFMPGVHGIRPITWPPIARLGGSKSIRLLIGILSGGVEVGLVALEAEEGLVLLEKIVGHRAVRVVADGAVFDHRFVLEDKGALIAGMTGKAEVVQPLLGAEHPGDGVPRAVGIVTVGAAHLALFHRVAGDEIHLGLDVPVAAAAKLKFVLGKELGLGIVVDLVAIGAGHVVFGVL